MWSWYTGRWWVGCYTWYIKEGTGRGRSPPRPLLAVPNVTAHLSTASVPITVLLHNGPLLCGFDVPIKRLTLTSVDCKLQIKHYSRFMHRLEPHKLTWKLNFNCFYLCSECNWDWLYYRVILCFVDFFFTLLSVLYVFTSLLCTLVWHSL